MLWTLLALAIYWLVLFVVCFILVEYGQNYFYDEVTPGAAWKVALGTLGLAALMTWARTSFETMFTSDIAWTLLQAIAWFAVFTLVFQFHPMHALSLGLVAFVLVSGMATLAVDSVTRSGPPPETRQYTGPAKVIRRPLRTTVTPPADPKAEPAKEAEAPAKK